MGKLLFRRLLQLDPCNQMNSDRILLSQSAVVKVTHLSCLIKLEEERGREVTYKVMDPEKPYMLNGD